MGQFHVGAIHSSRTEKDIRDRAPSGFNSGLVRFILQFAEAGVCFRDGGSIPRRPFHSRSALAGDPIVVGRSSYQSSPLQASPCTSLIPPPYGLCG